MVKRVFSEDQRMLYDILSRLDTVDDIANFMADLCTPKEIELMVDRLKVAQLIHQGKSYRNIYQTIGVSPTTISRVARTMQLEGNGYRLVFIPNHERVNKQEEV